MPGFGSVDVAATDLVRSGHAFRAGKLAFFVRSVAARYELSIHDEWNAFLGWAEQFNGLVPQSLLLTGDWCATEKADMTVVAPVWNAFRSGWLVASSDVNRSVQ